MWFRCLKVLDHFYPKGIGKTVSYLLTLGLLWEQVSGDVDTRMGGTAILELV